MLNKVFFEEGSIYEKVCRVDGSDAKLTREISELPDKEQLILVYCRSGNRSKQASEKLAKLGYTNVVEFDGINDWTGETVSGVNETDAKKAGSNVDTSSSLP